MSKKILLILAVLTAVVFAACNGSSGSPKGEIEFDKDATYALGLSYGTNTRGAVDGTSNIDQIIKGFKDGLNGKDSSYAIGLSQGANLRRGMASDDFYPDIDEFMKGFIDGIKDNEPRFDLEEAYQIFNNAINQFYEQKSERERAEAEQREQDKEREFLSANLLNPGVIETDSGLQYEIIVQGDGDFPLSTSTVLVEYEGTFLDGTVFDSSALNGQPIEFQVNGVIKGWTEGLQLMNIGSTFKFYIPYELAYGSGGNYNIPPYSTLIFTVELLDITVW